MLSHYLNIFNIYVHFVVIYGVRRLDMWYKMLRELREERGLTQKNVADFLKMSRTGYSHYESGHSQPSIEQIIKLADFYQVTTDYLLNVSKVNLRRREKFEKQIDDTILLLNEVKKGYHKP